MTGDENAKMTAAEHSAANLDLLKPNVNMPRTVRHATGGTSDPEPDGLPVVEST